MRNTFTTNGMLATRRRMDALAEYIDGVAVSLDGMPESHDRIRGRRGAFDTMRGRLAHIRDAGIPFGFIFTLTQHNLHELPWVAEFAVDEGARLLQIHPIEEVGRGAEQMQGTVPDEAERTWAFLLVSKLKAQYADVLAIQLDLCDRLAIAADPALVQADVPALPADASLSEWLDLLVLEADGSLVPLQYGFPRPYALGNAQTGRLRDHARRWIRTTAPRFRSLCRRVHAQLLDPDALPFHNWFQSMADAATREPVPLRLPNSA